MHILYKIYHYLDILCDTYIYTYRHILIIYHIPLEINNIVDSFKQINGKLYQPSVELRLIIL